MNPSSWMNDTTAIHSLPLRRICIPTTHDSGTYALTNPMVGAPGLPEPLVLLYNQLPQIAEKLSGVGPQAVGEILAETTMVVQQAIFDAVKGLATANTSTIAQQLMNGMRGLDLRICQSDGAFYTYHGLRGIPLATVLEDIANFLQQPNGGEILYVTFGHYEGFRAGSPAEESLLEQIQQALGAYAYPPQVDESSSSATILNDVFEQTWQQIVTLNGAAPQTSRVILVNGTSAAPSAPFWPKTYSPPDSNNSGMAIYGAYTNTDDLDTMLQGQTANFTAAQNDNLPFALYMTLTPSGDDYTDVIVNDIGQGLLEYGGQLQAQNGRWTAAYFIGGILVEIGNKMQILYPLRSGFSTLAVLASEVDSQLDQIIQENFAPAAGQPNSVSMIYLDYYETTNVVDVAIALSCSGT